MSFKLLLARYTNKLWGGLLATVVVAVQFNVSAQAQATGEGPWQETVGYGPLNLIKQEEKSESKPVLNSNIQVETTIRNEGGGYGPGGEPRRDLEEKKKTPEPPARRAGLSFSDWVEQYNGAVLKEYGREAFKDWKNSLQASDLPAPKNYEMGPGDEIKIQAWGQINIDTTEIVDKEGSIFLRKIGRVYLAGQPISKLEGLLSGKISQYYQNYRLSATVSKVRSLPIYVTGFTNTPGLSRVTGFSTFIQAIFSVANPNEAADLRNIELIRNNKIIANIDLYRFLKNGNMEQDVQLQAADVINLKPQRGLAAIIGSVNAPAIYQITENSKIREIFELAGGLSTSASKTEISLIRISGNADRIMLEFPYDENTLEQRLNPGDIIISRPISPKLNKIVSIRGNVASPRSMQWFPGMTIRDLVPDASALMLPNYWISRTKETNLSQLFSDKHVDKTIPTLPEINWDYAALERVDPKTLNAAVVAVDLRKAVLEKSDRHNILLQPNDILTVFARQDFIRSVLDQQRYVRIEGEVRNPGVYQVDYKSDIPTIIKLAGGLTDAAYLYGMEFTRKTTKDYQINRTKELVNRLEQDAYRGAIRQSKRSEDRDQASYSIRDQTAAIDKFIAALKRYPPNGRVVLNAAFGIKELEQIPRVSLENGDTIYIPPVPEVVTALGQFNREGPHQYVPGMTLADVIEAAGGLTSEVETRNIHILRMNGSMRGPSRGFFQSYSHDSTEIYPGDTVIAIEDMAKIPFITQLKDWTQILYQFGIGAVGLAILKN